MGGAAAGSISAKLPSSQESFFIPPDQLHDAVEALGVGCIGTLVLLLCIPPLHQPIRLFLRPWVVWHVERGYKWVTFAQSFANPILTTLFALSSKSVGTAFYILCLPALIWAIDPQLGYLLAVLLGFSLYVGNGLKDLCCAPRPQGIEGVEKKPWLLLSPGGVPSEELSIDSLEYGFPSSHTMNSLCLNFFIVRHLEQHGKIDAARLPYAYVAAALWVGWIGVSRIYMGLHTPVDILGGGIGGTLALGAFLRVAKSWEAWARSGSLAAFVQLVGLTVLLRLHPRPLAHTPSYEYTVTFSGVVWGIAAALAVASPQDLEQPLPLVAGNAPRILGRFLLGFLLVFLGKEGSKLVLQVLLPPIYRACPVAVRRLWQPPLHSFYQAEGKGKEEEGKIGQAGDWGIPLNKKGEAWDLEVTARFFSYAAVGFCVVFVAPWTFGLLGI